MLNRSHMPTRAPALYLLLVLIAGLCAARAVTAPIGLALAMALLLAALSWRLSRPRDGLWLLSFLAAGALAFWAYGSLRLPRQPETTQLERPIREARLHFEVERVMQAHNDYGKATGIARVIEATPTKIGRASCRERV